MKNQKQAIIFAGILGFIASVLLFQGRALSDNKAKDDEWKAPEKESRRENPVPADVNSLAAGKAAYIKHCLSCHGETGKGDGPAVETLTKSAGDLSDPNMWKQSDGELFWKITTGRTPMPYFEKRIKKEIERWSVVNYIRTFAPRPEEKSAEKNKPV